MIMLYLLIFLPTLTEALAQKDGEDIMLDIFDSTQIDLVKQRKALEKQKQKVCTTEGGT